ncbi:HAD family hydrolase [Staphylococcus capitis]|uniref:HAD family hydrolase n=1 Tax=Staphylococcus capitis TaxID=29388 RepID=UPI001D140AA7|nr:HAD hydrolase-like protein [Staphylococcus capitis]MCC3754507.1 HAD hydrolase-like protein [Staphylococcus capitis]MDH8728888.1 HAD hydrolase-like protein [Staphylococcus capitis]MDH8921739.1 HAD hydrolase-like protein [Staphylococcus capitis]MDH8943380.1 HAD hydrolase-like protein [Staphylococcus capitis]MDH9591573.1 HAD hydrolase-like protein [Staphylococcus capitis]
MKSILFDVDGVFLSEERCFDVSAITVEELLTSEGIFLGCGTYIDFENDLNDKKIQEIRERVFQHDKILNQLKSLGLNSNWDMLFIVFSIHLIDLAKQLDQSHRCEFLNSSNFNEKTLFEMNKHLLHKEIDYEKPIKVIDSFRNGKDAIYEDLESYAKDQLEIDDTELFKLKSNLWQLAKDTYQEWYLGKDLFNKVEEGTALLDFKKGFIYEEVILKPQEEIQLLLQHLKEAGYHLAIATGRPRTETIIPFESLGLKSYFDDEHIVTASEVLDAESDYPEYQPLGKPNPFSYIATLNGNDRNRYKEYATHQENIVNKDEVYIVGDSLADLLSAKKIGATFIGTLTGLKGDKAQPELEEYGADYIVEDVTKIRNILL